MTSTNISEDGHKPFDYDHQIWQQNSSLVCTSWSRTVTIAPCRTKWSEITLLLAFGSKPYHKAANGLWTDPWEGQTLARQRTTADAGKHHNIDFICRLHKQLQLEGQEISISFIQVLHCMTSTFEIYETWWRPHPCHLCPAKDVQCHNCKHKGHFAVHCCSKSVAEVGNTPPLEQDYMILLISTLLAHN